MITLPILAHIPGGLVLDPPTSKQTPGLLGFAEVLSRTFTAPQRVVAEAQTRFKMLCCGRRFGKTYLAVSQLLIWALHKPDGLFWYVTATYRAAKRIAWKALRHLAPRSAVASINHSELTITLVNGASVSLLGADSPDSLRGVSLSGCVIDEAAYVDPRAWTEVIRPALSDQEGPCWHITTPRGFNHFHDLWEAVEDDPTWSRFSYTTIDGGHVSVEEIAAAKRDLDARTFRQEYLASFETAAGRVYYDFDDQNIRDDISDIGGDVLIGIDFNVGVMAGVICSLVGRQLHQWDEIAMPNSNTDEVCAYLSERFAGRRVIVYPDPTGSARKSSSAGMTDHGIIRRPHAYHTRGFTCVTPTSPWSVKDKINATNGMICNATGERNYFVHPKNKNTIRACRSVTFKEGSEDFVIDKTPNIEHWTDGLGYLILSAANRMKPWPTGGTSVEVW
jgi:hypothetical protein